MLLSAYIVPHPPIILNEIGHGEEEKIAATRDAYCEIARKIAKERPDTILIFSPHAPSYYDYISISSGKDAFGDFSQFRATQVKFNETYDEDLIDLICREVKKAGVSAGTLGDRPEFLDHGTMVPLYFIEKEYTDFQLVRIAVSSLEWKEQQNFGKCIAKALSQTEKRVCVIASGDLSHKLKADGPYGYCEEGPLFDETILTILRHGWLEDLMLIDDELAQKSAQCGLPSFLMLSGILSQYAYRTNVTSYENTFGVGYGICEIQIEQDAYVALAKKSLEHFVRYDSCLPLSHVTKEMKQPAAVFVSLKKHGKLRGCIGTIFPTKDTMGEEIIANAISAGTRDPRFTAVTKDELKDLEYSVDILGEPQNIDSLDQLDVKRYGIIVGDDHHRGLLLPDLEGVDTVEDQVRIALSKAGMDEEEPFYLQRFEVIRHHEM